MADINLINHDHKGESERKHDGDTDKCSRTFAYKNLFIIALSFCLLFTAFQSLQNLQSSIHKDPNTGFISLCVVYGLFMVSSLFLPPLMMKKLGYKSALLMSMFGYLAFTVAHFHAKLWLMVIGSILLGTSAAVLWASQSCYISILATRFGKRIGKDPGLILSKFLSLFFIAMNIGQIFGNVISSLVLKKKSSQLVATNSTNTSAIKCGPYFCPSASASQTVSGQAQSSTIFILVSIYAGVILLAILNVIVFLSPLKKTIKNKFDTEVKEEPAFSLIMSTIYLIADKKAMLLFPAALFSGMSEGFIFGDFTQTYVTCFLGIENVGWVMVCFGVCSACFAAIMSQITKWLDSHKLLLCGLLLSLCALIWCRFYDVSNMDKIMVYVTSGVLGVSSVTIVSQLFAVYGANFKEKREAAFSMMNVFRCLGYVIVFGYGDVLCIEVKIYILIGVLSLAIVCLVYLMNGNYKTNENQRSEDENIILT